MLAIIIALDQFPRHIFRGTPDAFSVTSEAEAASRHLLSKPESSELTPIETIFSLTPITMRRLIASGQAVSRIETLRNTRVTRGNRSYSLLRSFKDHALIIERFDRFPQCTLNRSTTEQERLYLKSDLNLSDNLSTANGRRNVQVTDELGLAHSCASEESVHQFGSVIDRYLRYATDTMDCLQPVLTADPRFATGLIFKCYQ